MRGLRLFATDVCLTHLQRNCPEKSSCTEKDCARTQDHHLLLHISTKNEIEDVKGNPAQSSPVVSNLPVNNVTTESNRRSFVLLKVVPLRMTAENGRTLTTYGILDSAAVSSVITSNIADKLQLQGVPEKVSINTVTQRDQNLELCKVKFQISSASQGSPSFPVYHALFEKFECVRPLLPKSTGFVSLATPQWSSIAKYCCRCE